MERISLNGEWNLSFVHPETENTHRIPATVPGNVELDLERAGLLADALPATGEHAGRWVDLADWTYEREFDFPGLPAGMEKAVLSFDGIDTVAEVFLNGELLFHSENMFIAHSADVTGKLKTGTNTLAVRIAAPEIAARKFTPPPFPSTPREPSLYLRKARHMWGWDNAPHRLSAGLWRGVNLEFLPPVRFESVYACTESVRPQDDSAELMCRYAFTTPDRDLSAYRLRVRLVRNGECAIDSRFPVLHTSGRLSSGKLEVKHPALWFPAGYGEPHLYDFLLELEKDGIVLARHSHKLGIRRIRLERTETTTPEGGGEFCFFCNNEKIYVRGTNWKPLSPYHSQTPERMRQALELALECNCNLIRVWGGGIYEDKAFFDFCDEHGLLVWQDFMFACEFPPQEEFFLREIAREAEAVIVKFRNHPSLALWCGDNETDMAFFWGSMIERNLRPSHNRVSREVLLLAVRNFDPARDYLPSSPYIADSVADLRGAPSDPMMDYAPEQHVYPGPLTPGGFREFFAQSAAHFISETGPLRVNAMSESPEIVARELPRLRRLWNTAPESIPLENDLIHQTDRYCAVWTREARLVLNRMFGREFSPENPDELVAAVNFYVADLFKFAVESYRMQKFRRTGIVWWSLLDMWPMAFNYSVIDSNFRKKLPFDFLRLAQQPLALMAKDPDSPTQTPQLYAVNDTLSPHSGTWSVETEDGTVTQNGEFQVAPNSVQSIAPLQQPPGEIRFLHWKCSPLSGRNFHLRFSEPYSFDRCRLWSELIRHW